MDNQQELKRKFAEAMLKLDGDPFKAAFSIIPDVGLAMQAANTWPTDPIVAEAKILLLEEKGLRSFLPTKDEQARDIYNMANCEKLDAEVRLKAHRLYAEIMGNIERPALPTASNTNIIAQNVMVVKDHGTNDDWEMQAMQQQGKLVHGNA